MPMTAAGQPAIGDTVGQPVPGQCTFAALGTFATLLVADPDALRPARDLLTAELAAIDAACSRFRRDSELWRACAAGGRPVPVSPLFAEALGVALAAARLTAGDVDPTCGRALVRLGYAGDFALARRDESPLRLPPVRGGAWAEVRLDVARGEVTVPDGVLLDLGATAKALAADRAATAIAAAAGCGVLVNLGGDVSVAGPCPPGGWLVGVADDARFDTTTGSVRPAQAVLISDGGLATSSVLGRAWRRGDMSVHHIVTPATGLPARTCWRTVTVAARCCVDANVAATAAILRAERAVGWLARLGLPARLVRHDGGIVTVAGWPGPVSETERHEPERES
jgi:FAD:protein FMN transferase